MPQIPLKMENRLLLHSPKTPGTGRLVSETAAATDQVTAAFPSTAAILIL